MQEMDPDYDLKTWDISLKKITLFKVIMDIVEVSKLNPSKISIKSQYDIHISKKELIIKSRAIEKAKNLQLPKTLITDIIHMIQPIMKEIFAWYKVNGDSVCPILTPQGTVDVQKSAKAMFEFSGLPVMTLFKVACRYFMEDEIFDYGKRLTEDEKKSIFQNSTHNLDYFWLVEVYQQEFNKKKTLEGLSAWQCFYGFDSARRQKLFFSLERFLGTCLKDAHSYMAAEWIYSDVYNHKMSPVLLWQLKKIDRFGRFGRFQFTLLESLLNWPYQHLFAKAAKTLVTSLSESEYANLLSHIVRLGGTGYKDHDYGGLFKCFWKMGKQHRKSEQTELRELHCLLWSMVKMKDNDIAFMVFDYMFQTCKHWMLSEFNELCAGFIILKKYEMLRILWDMGATRDTRVHLKFKNFYESQRGRRSNFIGFLIGFFVDIEVIYPSVVEWNAMLEEFQSVVSGWETS